VAFTYGLKTDPLVAAEFLRKLTMQSRHAYIAPHDSSITPAKNQITLKVVTNAFTRMPKLSAAHMDGWTWKLLRDSISRSSTTTLLRQIAENFSNGALPKDLWTYLVSTLMYPFHKKLHEERILLPDPALMPVTVGFVITRFGRRALVRMNRMVVAKT